MLAGKEVEAKSKQVSELRKRPEERSRIAQHQSQVEAVTEETPTAAIQNFDSEDVIRHRDMGCKHLRKTGIEFLGDCPWGTHFCQFYQTKEDLIDILVPYLKTGLENNEFCMWITSEPLGAEDAKRALKKKVKDLDDYIKKGQIEILDFTQRYIRSGRFDADEVLQGWGEKEKQALEKGFDGLRLTGNTFWLEKRDWKDFTDYEAAVNSVIGQHHMLAVCTYSLDKCGASEIVDVVSNHQFALVKRQDKWETIESAEYRKMAQALRESRDELQQKVRERTASLLEANEQLKEENEERLRAEQSLRLEEARLDALFQLSRMSEASVDEIAGFTLEQGVKLTQSRIGFLGFLSEDESIYNLHAVSKDVVKGCGVTGDPVQWHIAKAGIWADAIRQRKTLFVNDYSKPHPSKKGLPPGHPPIERLMVVPVFEGKRIVAVAGVGNKASDYDNADDHQIMLLLSGMWGYIRQNRSKEALQRAHDGLERRVEERTAELKRANEELQKEITERKRIEEALWESKRQLSIRNNIAEIYLTTPDDEMYGEVLQVLLEAMESKYGVFGYIDEDGALVCPSMTRDVWEQCQIPDKTIVFPREKWGGIWGQALIEKKTLYANEGLHVPEGHVPIARVLVVPIMYGGEAVGVLEVANKDTDYSHKDQEFLETVAGKIAPILNARLQRDRKERERKQAEQDLKHERDKLINILDSMADGVYIANQQYDIEYINPILKKEFGKVNGRKCYDYFHDRTEICPWCRNKDVFKGKTVRWEWYSPTNGKTYDLLDTPMHNADGSISKLEIFRDITERKEAERKIMKFNEELEQRVADRTAKLTKAHEQLLQDIEDRKRLEREILDISEREKRLIGQELHDGIGQHFTGIAFMTRALQQRIADKLPHEAADAAQISELVNEAVEQARRLAKGLHPVDLSGGSLPSALQELALTTERLFGIRCSFKCDVPTPIDDSAVAVHLYRITQEAITNAIKHGRAKNIRVRLACGRNKFVLAVKSDGLDFPKEFEARGTGMGLQIMDHRVDIIGGSLNICKAAKGGTIVTCVFPNKKH